MSTTSTKERKKKKMMFLLIWLHGACDKGDARMELGKMKVVEVGSIWKARSIREGATNVSFSCVFQLEAYFTMFHSATCRLKRDPGLPSAVCGKVKERCSDSRNLKVWFETFTVALKHPEQAKQESHAAK